MREVRYFVDVECAVQGSLTPGLAHSSVISSPPTPPLLMQIWEQRVALRTETG